MEVDPGSPAAPRRLFCPVGGCPCADANSARGWTSDSTVRAHVDAHLAGSLSGRVPAGLASRSLFAAVLDVRVVCVHSLRHPSHVQACC